MTFCARRPRRSRMSVSKVMCRRGRGRKPTLKVEKTPLVETRRKVLQLAASFPLAKANFATAASFVNQFPRETSGWSAYNEFEMQQDHKRSSITVAMVSFFARQLSRTNRAKFKIIRTYSIAAVIVDALKRFHGKTFPWRTQRVTVISRKESCYITNDTWCYMTMQKKIKSMQVRKGQEQRLCGYLIALLSFSIRHGVGIIM